MRVVLYLLPLCLFACAEPPPASAPDTNTTPPPTDDTPAASHQPPADSPFPWAGERDDASCSDSLDNDNNRYADCDDFGCSRNPAVTVCDSAARYEMSAALCNDQRDNDGDGLIDCADPDCSHNPFHNICPAPAREELCDGSGDGPGDSDSDSDGFVGCDDYDCLLSGACDTTTMYRVLFDQSLDETSANGPNSNWMVDGWQAHPSPSNPSSGDDWRGALSDFAFALWNSGLFLVESRPAWLPFAPGDLDAYDVVVLVEPSRLLSDDEKRALIEFVDGGGGLLLVANHVGADRDGNGVSAPQAFNDLLQNNPVRADPFGFLFDEVDISIGYAPDTLVDPTHPVLNGPAGSVARIGLYQGCTAHLTGSNPTASGLILLSRTDPIPLVAGAAEVGTGRVVFVTDSAICGDGSSSHGGYDSFKDSWNAGSEDNAALFVNAVHWLAGGRR